jgi:hypothetical protein
VFSAASGGHPLAGLTAVGWFLAGLTAVGALLALPRGQANPVPIR